MKSFVKSAGKRSVAAILSLLLMLGVFSVIPEKTASADVVAYNQYVSPWGSYYYGGGSIAATGCGILSTTNAINYMTGAFNTTAKANAFIQSWASYAHSIGGYNPGSSSSGGYRYILFGTDVSNPPPLATKYGSTYSFNMPITWTENWNSANYYNGSYYNNIYVNSQTSLKNYLAGNGVAIAHVPGHFICLASYNPNTDMFLVLDSAPTTARGTGSGVAWVSAYNLSGGRPALTVGGFCVLNSTAPATPTYSYPYQATSDTLMLYDGENKGNIAADYNTTTELTTSHTQGTYALKMNYANPTGNSSSIGGMVLASMTSAANLTDYSMIYLDVYFPKALTGSHGLQINFATSGSDGYNAMKVVNNYAAGWHTLSIEKATLDKAVSTADWSKINKIRVTWFNYAGLSGSTYFILDNIRAVKGTAPSIYPYTSNSTQMMLYDGESLGGLTTAYNTSLSLNSTKTQGSKSLKMACTNPSVNSGSVGGMVLQSFKAATDLSSYTYMEMDLYVSRTMTGSNGFQINFGAGSQDGYNVMKGINDWTAGWHTIKVTLSDIAATKPANADWTKTDTIRYTWFNYHGSTDTTTYFLIDNVRLVKETPPTYPYVVDDNTLMLYDGETTTGLTSYFSTALTTNTGNITQGARSLKMTFNSPAAGSGNVGGMALQALSAPTDLSGYSHLEMDVYFSRAMTGSNGLQINFGAGSQDGYNCMKRINDFNAGWHKIRVTLSDIPAAKPANADWTKTDTIRYTWYNYEASTASTYFLIDNVRLVKEVTHSYPYKVDDTTMMIFDGESNVGITTAYSTSVVTWGELTQGSRSLKVTFNSPAAQSSSSKIGGLVLQGFNAPTDLSKYTHLLIDVYFSRDMTGSNGLQINFGAGSQDGYNCMLGINDRTAGWHTFEVALADIPAAKPANADWTKTDTVRYAWFNYTGADTATYFLIDNVRLVDYTAAKAKWVMNMIEALPVTITLSDESVVVEAREAYEALTEEEKTEVTNLTTLEAAEARIEEIKEENAKAIANVVALIEALPETVTLADKHQIETAKAEYDALGTTLQQEISQELVTKLETALADLEKVLPFDLQFRGFETTTSDYSAERNTGDKLEVKTDIPMDGTGYITTTYLSGYDKLYQYVYGYNQNRENDDAGVNADGCVMVQVTDPDDLYIAFDFYVSDASVFAAEGVWGDMGIDTAEKGGKNTWGNTFSVSKDILAPVLSSLKTGWNHIVLPLTLVDDTYKTELTGTTVTVEDFRLRILGVTLPAGFVCGLDDVRFMDGTATKTVFVGRTAAKEITKDIYAFTPNSTYDEFYTIYRAYNQLDSEYREVVLGWDTFVKTYLQYAQEAQQQLYVDIESAKMVEEMITALPEPSALTAENCKEIDDIEIAYDGLSDVAKSYVPNYQTYLDAKEIVERLEVEAMIDALPNPVGLSHEAQVIAARNAFDGLTETQQALVTNADKLTLAESQLEQAKEQATQEELDQAAAQVVIDQIDALPETLTEENGVAVEQARQAYEGLTDAQKGYVTNLAELEAAEETLTALKVDLAAARQVMELISYLPSPVTPENEGEIQEARAAYNALTDTQKGYVTNLAVLEAAEAQLEQVKQDIELAKEVEAQIAALPATVTLADEITIVKAREAYDGLSALQKDYVSNLDVLEQAETNLALAKESATKEELDQAAAALVDYKISKLPSEITLADEQAIVEVRLAYEDLTADQKALVNDLAVLESAEETLATLKEQLEKDKQAALAVDQMILALPAVSEVAPEDAGAIESARAAYDALTDVQKELVEHLLTLENAEEALAKVLEPDADKEAAKLVEDMINALPGVDAITWQDKEQVEAVRKAYEELSQTQKGYVTNLAILEQAEKVLETPVKLGDVNGDDSVDAKDALLVLKFAVGKAELTETQQIAAEVDGKEGINAKDALEILKFAVKKITVFPIEK